MFEGSAQTCPGQLLSLLETYRWGCVCPSLGLSRNAYQHQQKLESMSLKVPSKSGRLWALFFLMH